jgi:probable O-glycosylation ligase (exosortase A-associated)
MRRRVMPRTTDVVGTSEDRSTNVFYWWLLLAIAFEYIRPAVFFPPLDALKLNSLIPLTLLVAVLFAPGLRPFKTIFGDRYARWLVVFLFLILISVPFAEVTEYAYKVFKNVLANFFLFLIIARVATSQQRLRGIFAILIATHLFLLLMSPALILNPEIRSYVRGAPFLGDGNDFSLSLCILLPMAIELARNARTRVGQVIAWGTFVLLLLGIIGTQSRGAALGGIAVFGFLWLTSKQKAATLVGIGVVAVIVVVAGSETYFNRMNSIKDYESDGSAEARILAWKAGVQMARDNPVFGVGAGHFPLALGTKYKPAEVDRWMTAHSMYFLVLGELGLPGLLTLCALVFGGIFTTLKVRRRILKSATDPPSDRIVQSGRLLGLLSASGIGLAVAGAFLSVAYYPHLFILTGIMLSARAISLSAGQTVVPEPRGRQGTSIRDEDANPKKRVGRFAGSNVRSFGLRRIDK